MREEKQAYKKINREGSMFGKIGRKVYRDNVYVDLELDNGEITSEMNKYVIEADKKDIEEWIIKRVADAV